MVAKKTTTKAEKPTKKETKVKPSQDKYEYINLSW